MKNITNTNIRVGPGVYLALKHISDKTGKPMGFWANFLITLSFATKNGTEILESLPDEIQTALLSDSMSIIGDLFKMIGMEAINNTNIADLYQKLLKPEKNPLVS